jgi:hypothetical protein
LARSLHERGYYKYLVVEKTNIKIHFKRDGRKGKRLLTSYTMLGIAYWLRIICFSRRTQLHGFNYLDVASEVLIAVV